VDVASIVVGPIEGQAALENVARSWIFHPFEVENLGTMVTIMSILTTKSAREVRLEDCCFFSSLGVCCYFPLGDSSCLDSG
jgi:hypothetical protein